MNTIFLFRFNLHILLILIIGIPFIASAQNNQLCEHLTSFASKSKVDKPLKVKLINDWGKYSKSCENNGTQEVKEFCNYLMKNTATEFMNINFSIGDDVIKDLIEIIAESEPVE